ncbi:hypothetical protein L3Q82_025298, partial [Scortum barcoo]
QTFPEKLDIVKRGRSIPSLASLSQPGQGFVCHFQTSAYERGFANLRCLTKAAGQHQAMAGHLQAAVLLRTFGEARVDLQLNEQVRRETELQNE